MLTQKLIKVQLNDFVFVTTTKYYWFLQNGILRCGEIGRLIIIEKGIEPYTNGKCNLTNKLIVEKYIRENIRFY